MERDMQNKITVVTYVHEAHKPWIPFWAEQIAKQEFQDFDVLFIAHNWGEKSVEQDCQNSYDVLEMVLPIAVPPLSNRRLRVRSHYGPPVIGDVIDFGCKHVKTEFFAHWDVDDIIHPKRLLLQSDYLDTHPEIDFLNARAMGFTGDDPKWPDLYYHDQSSSLLEYLTDPNLETNEQIKECFSKRYNCLTHGLMIYRPEVLKQLGGFSKSDVKIDGISPDWATWQKAMNAGFQFYRLPELLMQWRLDSSAIRR